MKLPFPGVRLSLILIGCLAAVSGNHAQQTISRVPDKGQVEPSAVKLTGIIHFANQKRAALQIRGPRGNVYSPLLRDGERQGSCEVLAIDEKSATVRIRNNQTEETLQLPQNAGDELAQRTLNLQGLSLPVGLDLYQMFSGRTVLAPARLSASLLNVKSGAALSTNEAVKFLDDVLAKEGLVTLPRGDRFVFVLEERNAESLAAFPQPPANEPADSPPPAISPKAGAELFPEGLIRFQDTDVVLVLDLYQELSGRTVLRPGNLPAAKLTMRSQTTMTRSQAIWMLDAELFIANLRVVPETDKFDYVVPLNWKETLPKFEANAVAAKLGKNVIAGEVLPAGLARFMDAQPAQVLALYASLADRNPLPLAPNIPRARFNIRTQTALTRAESLFALEALAALNHLQFQPVGDEEVALVLQAAPSQ